MTTKDHDMRHKHKPRQCSVEGCERRHRSRGFCRLHYDQFRATGALGSTPLCLVWGCEEVHAAQGYCKTHYYRKRKYGDPLRGRDVQPTVCVADGCDAPVVAKGCCSKHYYRNYRRVGAGAARAYYVQDMARGMDIRAGVIDDNAAKP